MSAPDAQVPIKQPEPVADDPFPHTQVHAGQSSVLSHLAPLSSEEPQPAASESTVTHDQDTTRIQLMHPMLSDRVGACYARGVSSLDLSTRAKIAFVVERYGGDEAGEAGRRTRALAAALADRGHDVSVLTTCTRRLDADTDDVAPGETSLDGVRVVRFRSRRSRLEKWTSSPRVARWRRMVDSVVPMARRLGYDRYTEYLDHRGQLFDAVLFTGAWTDLVSSAIKRVRRGILAPPPVDGFAAGANDAAGLVRASRAIALASPEEVSYLRREAGLSADAQTFVIGACPEPCCRELRSETAQDIVEGPYLLCVAHDSLATASLVEAFRTFREAYARTPFEDDRGQRIDGSRVRLVFGGDPRHVHAPADGILSLGVLDDPTRSRLVSGALAVIHPDPSARLPQSLLEAWSAGRPTLARVQSPALSKLFERAGSDYTFESPSTFAACAASLLSRRGPREAFGARARQVVAQDFSPAKVANSIESWIAAARGRIVSVQSAG